MLYFDVFVETDTSKTLVYSVKEFSLEDAPKMAWDGLDSIKVEGKVTYEAYFVTKEGPIFLVGNCCVISCDERAKIFQKKEGCFFPQQVGDDNRLDRG